MSPIASTHEHSEDECRAEINVRFSTSPRPQLSRNSLVLENSTIEYTKMFGNLLAEGASAEFCSSEGIGSGKGDELEEGRQQREEEESEALARQLMAEEAVASYNVSSDFLRINAHQFSQEDLAALEAAMVEEDPYAENHSDDEHLEHISEELTYDELLRLGDRIGDVKQERWTLEAKAHIENLPLLSYSLKMAKGKDENDSSMKCLVCQCSYEEGETLRCLPCKHYFHSKCVDQWLSSKEFCPYCRQSIVDVNRNS